MSDNLKCKSEHYKRDEGFYKCDLKEGHKGLHKHRLLVCWGHDD